MSSAPPAVAAATGLAAEGRWAEAVDTLLPLLGDTEVLRMVLPSLVAWTVEAGRPVGSLVGAIPADHAKLVLAGLGALRPGHAAELLEACTGAGWPPTTVLAAAANVAPALPLEQALAWSGRLRAAGFGASCPLLAIATGTRHATERALAAALAQQAFADPRALPAFAAAVDSAQAWRRGAIATQAERLCPGIVAACPSPVPLPPARVTVVIPCLDHVDLTLRCVDALERRTDPRLYELVVVDNGSTDGTRGLAPLEAAGGGRFHYVRNEENLGFSTACNQGAAAGQGELVLFLNNDTEVRAGWLEALLSTMDAEPAIGALQPKLLYPDGRLNDAGGLVLAGGQAWVYGKGDRFPGAPQFSSPRDLDYASGACLLVRRSAFEAVGGFDDRFSPAYYEDVDLSFALRAAGWRTAYEPRSEVVHVEGGTAGTDTGLGLKQYQVRNAERFATKWAAELGGRPDPDPAVAERWAHRPGDADGRSVLVVDTTVPAHDQAAGSQRLFSMLRCLRDAGHAVSFLAAVPGDERYARDVRELGIPSWDGDSVRILGPRQAAPGDPRPAFEDLLTTYAFDVVVLTPWDIAELLGERVRTTLPEALVVVDSVDLHFVRMERQAAQGDEEAHGLVDELRRRELAAYGAADRVVCVTAEEAAVVAAAVPGADVAVLPVVHDAADPGPGFAERSGVVFVGNFNHQPNVDALDWWAGEIAPRLARLLPGVPLTVVGHDPRSIAAGFADERTVVTGWVPSTLPHLHRARVSVAPLRYGAGMKGKVGEALAAGTPVVTTSMGSEGMELVDGEHVLCADDADAFAEAVARLHGDEALWDRLRAGGRAHERRHFGLDRMRRDLAGVLAPVQGDRHEARLGHAHAQVLVNRAQLRRLEDHAAALAARGDLDGALRTAAAAAQWAWFDHPGVFASPALEEIVARVGRQAVDGLPPWTAGTGRRRTVHVLTQAYSLGGHTRLAWRWMEHDTESEHAVVLTDQRGRPVPAELEAAAGGGLTLLGPDTPVGQVHELTSLLTGADLAVLHLHPSDAVAVAALADATRRPPTLLLNHADHVFWLGVGSADAVANLRPLGAGLTTRRRGVPAGRCLELPLPLDDRQRTRPRDKAKADLGLAPDTVVLATMASAYKYTPIGEPTFCQLVGEVLARTNCHLIAVGPHAGIPDWGRLAMAHPGRAHLLGSVDDPWSLLEAADVYLDSFPFSSLTSLLETAMLGMPTVTLSRGEAHGPLGADDFDTALVAPADGRAWVETVMGLVADEQARAAAGERQASGVRRAHLLPEWGAALTAAVDGVRHGDARLPAGIEDQVGAIDEVLWLLHRQAGISRDLDDVLAEYGVQR